MKKEKKVLRSIIAVIIVIGVFCISFVVRSRKFHSDRMGYSKVSQTGSDTDAGQKGNFGDTGVESGEGGSFAGEDAPPENVESGEGNSLAGENAASEEEETSQRINMEKAEREVKLKKQETDIKPLDDKTKAKLLDSVLDGKPEVVLKCRDVKAPDRMKRYKRVKLDVYSEDARKKLELLFEKAMQDNPNHMAYPLNWLNDIDRENQEENPGGENDAAKRITSAQLGYAVIGKEVRPVWILYGEVKKMGGSGNGYVLDAVTGETLWDMPNV